MSDKALVDNLILDVRAISDEKNTEDVSDADILSALNRAQMKLVRLAARHYEAMFQREVSISTYVGREATIPEYASGLIVDMIDVISTNKAYRIYQAPIRDMSNLDDTTYTSSIPRHYTIRGNKILLYPSPVNGTVIRVRYQIRPPELVEQQGRITDVTSLSSNILYVDSLGSNLTTSITALKAFVNIVDGTTGEVKSTNQISAIDTTNKKITFKSSSLDRSLVNGQTVSTSLSTDVALDDYITISNGTCIPTFVRDYSDYLIQHAVVEIMNRLGVPTQEAFAKLKELEDDVTAMWAGRPHSVRIQPRSKHWGRTLRTSRFNGNR
jgi:hypothetical protein